MKKKCKTCKKFKIKNRTSEPVDKSGRYTYRDEFGKRWYGPNCNECRKIISEYYHRKNGHKSLDDINTGVFKKSRDSEKLAANYFKKLGFKVILTKCHGSDLIIEKGNCKFTVEVKSVCRIRNTFKTKPVTDKRKNDDLVAIVFPDKNIYICSMKEHLKFCSKCGDRTVTKMVNKKGQLVNRQYVEQVYKVVGGMTPTKILVSNSDN